MINKFQDGGQYTIDPKSPQVLQRYITLLNHGIDEQPAFEVARMSVLENGTPGKFYTFGKYRPDLNSWGKSAADSLTTGRYKNLREIDNFNEFKQGLKQKGYNNRPSFYSRDLMRGRDKHKQIINAWNQQNGLPLVAMISTDNNYPDGLV